MCKIPNCLNTCVSYNFCNFFCCSFWYRKRYYLNVIFFNKISDLIKHLNFKSSYFLTFKIWIIIKDTFNNKASLFKVSIIDYSLTKITSTYYNHFMFSIYSKYFSYLVIKVLNIITITLLTKATKVIKVLSYL